MGTSTDGGEGRNKFADGLGVENTVNCMRSPSDVNGTDLTWPRRDEEQWQRTVGRGKSRNLIWMFLLAT